MRVAFVVADLTMLRYFVPFSRRLHEFIPSVEQTFYLIRGNQKYNGMSHDERYRTCIDILEGFCSYASSTTDSTGEFDVVFQVEVGTNLKCKRRISIQHGFDYAFKTEELKQQVDLYVCSSQLTCDDAMRHGVPSVAAPVPVSMWSIDQLLAAPPGLKTALVFYPDQGDAELACHVVSDLEDQGFMVFVKQRRKHQAIACDRGTHVYDEVWYPSEAIILPLSVDIVVGFGSSAFTDLVPMGVTYINVDIHHNQHPWSAFVHPDATNYTRVTDVSQVRDTVKDIASRVTRVGLPALDVEQLHDFMLGLMDG